MRARGLVLLLAAAMVSAGCGGDAPTASDAEGEGLIANPRRPVQVMLRQRAARLLAGDVDGYLAGLGPQARAFEEPMARTAVTLPLDRIDMTIGEATISDDGDRFRKAHVTVQYSYEGLPRDNPFRLRLLYGIDRQPDGEFLVTTSEFDKDPDLSPPPLWATGPVEVTRSPRFLVMARPGTPMVAGAAARAEEGLTRLLPKLTLEADDRYLLVAAGGEGDYAALGGDAESLAVAGVQYVATAGHPPRPEERHMVVNLEKVFGDADVTLEGSSEPIPAAVVFQHELAHLALSRFTRPCTNDWVVEGAAMLLADERRVGGWRTRATAAGGLASLRLNPPPAEEGEQDDEVTVDYPFANAAVLYLVEREGAGTFFDFYQNFKNLPVPDQLCSGRVQNVRAENDDRLLRRYYRIGVEELEGFTRDYIKKAVP